MMNDADAIARANELFYRAYENADMALMSKLWFHDSTIKCTYPGKEPLRGWAAISEGWAKIFAEGIQIQIILSEVEIQPHENFAYVSCLENLISRDTRNSILSASSLFQRIDKNWRLIHYHASPAKFHSFLLS